MTARKLPHIKAICKPTCCMIGIIWATYPYPSTSSSSSDPVFYTKDSTRRRLFLQLKTLYLGNLIYKAFKPDGRYVSYNISALFLFSFLMIDPSIIAQTYLHRRKHTHTYNLHLYPSHLTPPAPNHSSTFKFFIFLNFLHHYLSSIFIHPAHPKTSRRILSFPRIHHFLAFLPNLRCLFDRGIIAFLPDPSMDAHGRSVLEPSLSFSSRLVFANHNFKGKSR